MIRPATTRGVFFDVDFTLIYPGPRFQASGYQEFCARHGIDVDPSTFDRAVAEEWGTLTAAGTVPQIDALLAATARVHSLTLVTRNVKDVASTGVHCLDPFVEK